MSVSHSRKPGRLYMVATPIGNLEDITFRATRTLKEVDIIAAEDTRHTKKLLNHFNIGTPLISYYRENEKQRSHELIEKMKTGKNIALVSDAGTPGISDPGAVLARMARDHDLEVIPIPGPSAFVAALSVAGLDLSSFLFLGFAPAKKNQRCKLLRSLKDSNHPLVIYESVHRFHLLLTDCLEILGDRRAFMAREISKTFEDLQDLSLSELHAKYGNKNNKGEFVLIIYPGQTVEAEGENLEELLIWYRDQTDLSLKDVSKKLASDMGLSRSQVYQKALFLWNKKH